jgi:hypothetical protein
MQPTQSSASIYSQIPFENASAVFARWKTAEAVIEHTTAANTQLKQGVNEIGAEDAIFEMCSKEFPFWHIAKK